MGFEVWLYRLAISVLSVVLWFAIQRLIKKFDELISSIDKLTVQAGKQDTQIKVLNDVVLEHRERLNKHGDRIRDLELDKVKK